MAFVLLKDNVDESTQSFTEAWKNYRAYLDSIADKLPASAREFAIAEWHHDHILHKAPHDSWVKSVLIYETATGPRNENRQINIKISLLDAYHDGTIELDYVNVSSYQLGSASPFHGDWLRDEIRLSDAGLVIHEIEIAGNTWLIESADIKYAWLSTQQ